MGDPDRRSPGGGVVDIVVVVVVWPPGRSLVIRVGAATSFLRR